MNLNNKKIVNTTETNVFNFLLVINEYNSTDATKVY